jgi:hypothetical protein
MRSAVLVLTLAAAAVSAPTWIAAQSPPPHAPVPAPSPFRIAVAPAAFTGLARTTVSATDEAGQTHTYSGYALHDLLVRAGAPAGKALRGEAMASYVIATAQDDYRVVFTLADCDPSFTDRVIIIADARDGKPLDAHDGPYQIVVPSDKRPARWLRMLVSIELRNAPR